MTNLPTIKLKVCGMREPGNIQEVMALQPDFMGFIFYNKSPRYVGENFTVPDHFPDSILRVGVFVNEAPDAIERIATKFNLDYLQLHGDESVDQVKLLHASGFKIIKAFSIDESFDFALTDDYQPFCEYFLFDTKGKYYGGNASVFDWSLLKKYNQKTPFFLSGGLTPENIENIGVLSGLNIFSVDVNSGVEESPGFKSAEMIEQLIKRLKLSVKNDPGS